MKRLIVAVIFSFGVVTGPSVVPVDRYQIRESGKSEESSVPGSGTNYRQLNAGETAKIAGGGIEWCWTFYGDDADTYLICCADIWVMTICVGVNVSAWGREVLRGIE